jgi:hypothetical protein
VLAGNGLSEVNTSPRYPVDDLLFARTEQIGTPGEIGSIASSPTTDLSAKAFIAARGGRDCRYSSAELSAAQVMHEGHGNTISLPQISGSLVADRRDRVLAAAKFPG